MWTITSHVPGRPWMEVGIAAVEIAANIVEHAGADAPVWMRMEARVGLNEVRVDFTGQRIPERDRVGARPAAGRDG